MAATGKPLMKVADMDRLYLRAYFTSDQLSDLSVGQEVTVVADFGGDKQRISGSHYVDCIGVRVHTQVDPDP